MASTVTCIYWQCYLSSCLCDSLYAVARNIETPYFPLYWSVYILFKIFFIFRQDLIYASLASNLLCSWGQYWTPILLPSSQTCWDSRYSPSHLICAMLKSRAKVLCMLSNRLPSEIEHQPYWSMFDRWKLYAFNMYTMKFEVCIHCEILSKIDLISVFIASVNSLYIRWKFLWLILLTNSKCALYYY